MTYRGVDADRLEWLLRSGLSGDELKRFFKERRNPLIMKGEKVQNLPRSHEEALTHVIRFSDAAHGILGDWMRHQDWDGLEPFENQLLNYFRSMEACDLKLPDDETRKLSRCGLLHLYSPSPSTGWIEFLRTEMEANTETEQVKNEIATQATEICATLTPEVASAYAEWAVGVRSVAEIPDRTLGAAARLADAARSGNREILADLVITDAAWNEIARIHRGIAQQLVTHKRQGLVATAPPLIARDPNMDYLSLDVICSLSRNVDLGPYFLDVLCFCGSNGPFTLSEADLRAVVPDEGRVILHTNSRLPSPRPGVAAAYRVEFFKTPRTIRVRAIGFGERLYHVAYVPYASNQRDSVREWLRDRAQSLHGKLMVFVLADGMCIRPPGDGALSLSAPGFDWTFDSWEGLAGMELTQAAYVQGPLPDPDALYECSPVSVIARRFLKSLVERKEAKLTKKQITDLSGLLGAADVGMTDEHRRRIADNLSALASTDPFYDELIAEVMKSSEVQRDIEQRKQQAAKEADDELAKKRKLLENLRKDTQAQAERLTKLKETTEERAREIRASIRKAFEHAREHEAEVLGQLALWQELLNPIRREHGKAGTTVESSTVTGQRLSFVHLAPETERLVDVLRSAGVDRDLSEAYSVALGIARDLGLAIIVTGAGALYVGTRIGRALAERMVCAADIGVGLIEAKVLEPILADNESDVLVLRTANLSDLGVYATKLLEAVVETACKPPSSHSRRLTLLLAASGPAALPWPTEISQLSFKVDLSRSQGHLQLDEEAWLRALPSPLQRKLWSRIEHEVETRSTGDYARGVMRTMLWDVPDSTDGVAR